MIWTCKIPNDMSSVFNLPYIGTIMRFAAWRETVRLKHTKRLIL